MQILKFLFTLFLGFGVFQATSTKAEALQQAHTSDIAVLATKAFDEGDFRKAEELYEQLVQLGLHNGHVFYNLGNTYFRLGAKGKAMAAFLAARRYLPDHPDVKANLEFVHKTITDKVDYRVQKPWWNVLIFWTEYFRVSSQLIFASIVLGIGFSMLSANLLLKRLLILNGVGLVGVVMGLGLAGAALIAEMRNLPWGAVVSKEANVYSGPALGLNSILFKLNEGAPFLVREATPGWLRIGLSDGKTGWITTADGLVLGMAGGAMEGDHSPRSVNGIGAVSYPQPVQD